MRLRRPAGASCVDMGDGYDPLVVIENSDSRFWLILLCAAVAGIGGNMQYVGAMRQGRIDRSYSIPLVTNLWNLAHDTTFVASYDSWYNGPYSFWLLKMFWVGLIVFSLFELVVISQILRYAREDLFPGRSLAEAIGIYCVLQVMVFGIFWWFQAITDDPLEYYGLITTVILASAFNIPMMLARGSRRGMSEFVLWGHVTLALGFWPWMMLSDNHFAHPIYAMIAVGNVSVCFASIAVFRSLPAWDPESAAPALGQLKGATR